MNETYKCFKVELVFHARKHGNGDTGHEECKRLEMVVIAHDVDQVIPAIRMDAKEAEVLSISKVSMPVLVVN